MTFILPKLSILLLLTFAMNSFRGDYPFQKNTASTGSEEENNKRMRLHQ